MPEHGDPNEGYLRMRPEHSVVCESSGVLADRPPIFREMWCYIECVRSTIYITTTWLVFLETPVSGLAILTYRKLTTFQLRSLVAPCHKYSGHVTCVAPHSIHAELPPNPDGFCVELQKIASTPTAEFPAYTLLKKTLRRNTVRRRRNFLQSAPMNGPR